jgi:hypothetical protein
MDCGGKRSLEGGFGEACKQRAHFENAATHGSNGFSSSRPALVVAQFNLLCCYKLSYLVFGCFGMSDEYFWFVCWPGSWICQLSKACHVSKLWMAA